MNQLHYKTYLEVDVFQTAHNNSVHAILRDFKRRVFAEVLIVEKTSEDNVVKGTLILQSLDILRSVRVDALQRADKLVIESLNVGDDATRNLDVLLARLEAGGLLIVVPLLSVLNNYVIMVLLENL